MSIFNEQLPFALLQDIVNLRVEQDGRGGYCKAILAYKADSGEVEFFTTTNPVEISELQDICNFGSIPVSVAAPAHAKPAAAAGIPSGMNPSLTNAAFGIASAVASSRVATPAAAAVGVPGGGVTLHQVIAEQSQGKWDIADSVCNAIEKQLPSYVKIGALTYRNEKDFQVEPLRVGLITLRERIAALMRQTDAYIEDRTSQRAAEMKRLAMAKLKRKRAADRRNKAEQEAKKAAAAEEKRTAKKRTAKVAGKRRPR